jgi:uncharacterized membrane protein YdfJ with MMPL/SSD domain
MVALIIGMLICVALAVAVVAIVAIPARREGREILTPQGEELMTLAKEKTETALGKTGDALSSAKDKVADTVTSVGSDGNAGDVGRHRAS